MPLDNVAPVDVRVINQNPGCLTPPSAQEGCRSCGGCLLIAVGVIVAIFVMMLITANGMMGNFTSGCLVGTWCMNTIGDKLHLNGYNDIALAGCDCRLVTGGIAIRFGMPTLVAMFLFVRACDARGNRLGRCQSATTLTKRQAVARLRKYVRHVEDQRRRWANHEWLMRRPKKVRREVLMSPRPTVVGELLWNS